MSFIHLHRHSHRHAGEEWAELPDGRPLCLRCLCGVTLDTQDAQPLYDQVLAFYRDEMGLPLQAKVRGPGDRALGKHGVQGAEVVEAREGQAEVRGPEGGRVSGCVRGAW